jgi:2-aminoadipate transaminase
MSANAMIFDFHRGHPNDGLLPLHEMTEILAKVGSSENQEPLLKSLNYLKDDQGDPDLLEEIEKFVDRHTQNDDIFGTVPRPQECDGNYSLPRLGLFLTHGVSHGIEILCTTQTKPGDVVLIERPTYFLVSAIFASHGLVTRSLPMKQAGVIDVDRLSTLLDSGEIQPPRMIYIVPTHQNPTSRTMSIEDRWKLATLASRHGILVAADEVYHLLDWRDSTDEPRPVRMAVVGNHIAAASTGSSNPMRGCCLTVSSFTKIFAPGVRCGWIEGPPHIIESLMKHGYILSQGCCAPFMGEILRIALKEGIADRVLLRLNEKYRDRSHELCDILKTEPRIQIDSIPKGGYFLWITFPPEVKSASVFLEFCKSKGLKFLSGERCDTFHGLSGLGDSLLCNLSARLCFADMNVEDMRKGAKLLVSSFQEFMEMQSRLDF